MPCKLVTRRGRVLWVDVRRVLQLIPLRDGDASRGLGVAENDVDTSPAVNVPPAASSARSKSRKIKIRQLTDSPTGVDNIAGEPNRGRIVVFSSDGNYTGQNADGNREIFYWDKRKSQITQVTSSLGFGPCNVGLGMCAGDNGVPCSDDTDCGESTNSDINNRGRFITFESTADLLADGATNRRIFLFDRTRNDLLQVSRSRLGDNRRPRISRGRFIVWDSDADLTGNNPERKRVIYQFDRRKDD